MFEPIVDKPIPSVFWKLTDRWFRVLEMSLILGTLYYFKIKTGNLIIGGIYWISVGVLYMWFLESSDYIYIALTSNKKSSTTKWFIWIICTSLAVSLYWLITLSVRSLI